MAVSDAFMQRVLRPDPDRDAVRRLRYCAQAAWARGCPGLVFIDRLQDAARGQGRIETLVPCGEQGMLADETCNLGSVNLAAIDLSRTDPADPESLESVVRCALYCLDNTVDLLEVPDAAMAARSREMRRTGLGVTGFAQALINAGIADYASDAALAFAHAVGARFKAAADRTNRELAAERGGLWFAPGRRNITSTCIAPTGGITLLTGHYAFSVEPLFSEATRVPPAAHLRMQACWQQYVENSVSKTVNMAEQCSAEDVYRVYTDAYALGCKSITVYRDNSRTGQPISCAECIVDLGGAA